MSDHSPLCITFKADFSKFEHVNLKYKRRKIEHATSKHISKYQSHLDAYLSVIDLPIDCMNCTNILCTNTICVNTIKLLHNQIIFTLLKSSEKFTKHDRFQERYLCWNDYMKHLRCIASC